MSGEIASVCLLVYQYCTDPDSQQFQVTLIKSRYAPVMYLDVCVLGLKSRFQNWNVDFGVRTMIYGVGLRSTLAAL